MRLLKAAVIGGVIVFVWGVVSWVVIPWHGRVLHALDHDVDVARMLDFGAPRSGIYLYPPSTAKALPASGLAAFVSISKEGLRPKAWATVLGLSLHIFGAFLLSWLLSKTAGLLYGQKVLFASAFGLAVGLLGSGPNWIWWGFSAEFTWVAIADSLIAWTLAGCVLGKML
jgi:hypothetical protein